ncbi:MAG TPA: HAMP domain-containing sensor histidine kinase [Candidatus Nitrosotalea sp.]|nr:HAMP domain-containing sensor histidine kinase [Candidatus Nitrosotalea sp.]
MIQVEGIVADLTAAALLALGLDALLAWRRERGRPRGYLALALLLLALVAVLGRLKVVLALPGITAVSAVAFLGSGYGIFLFRHALSPVARRWRVLAFALPTVLVAAVLVEAVVSPTRPLTSTASWILVLTWGLLVGEPVVHFWLESSSRPRVQRSRMRFLSLGLGGLAMVLLAAVLGGSALRNPRVAIGIQVVVLLLVPLIWAGLRPPSWLRRIWRSPEEVQLRLAVRELLLFAPNRRVLAERALNWATRLVGADAGLVAEEGAEVLAATGLEEAEISSLLEDPAGASGAATAYVRFPLGDSSGILLVRAGPFTPVFGSDELGWLEAYSGSVGAGLERVGVTERLARLERSKTQFLNLASHELRGPLAVIRGYLSMFLDGRLGEDDARRALRVMSVKADDMNALVEQMLEAARLEDGRIELHPSLVDLRSVISSAAESLRPVIDEAHPVVLALPDEPVLAEIDVERIETVLRNLIDNAVKYSPRGGSVTCRLDIESGDERATIRVRDHGIGIGQAEQQVLFTKFGRVNSTLTSGIPGTGLGLYLARELVGLHGGEIGVESELGVGSTFSVVLPLTLAEAPPEMGVTDIPTVSA